MNFPLWRRKQKAQLDEEISAHLDAAIRERIARGEPLAQAEAAARREFGNVALIKEVTRDSWGWAGFERLLQDTRYGLRQLRRNFGFTLAAALTLGIAGALAASRVLRTLLFEVSATDPATLLSCTVLMTVVALLAASIPARRASRVDPLTALRHE